MNSKSQIAKIKLTESLEHLEKLQETGSTDQVNEKVDRWVKKTIKVINDFVSNEEATSIKLLKKNIFLHATMNPICFMIKFSTTKIV